MPTSPPASGQTPPALSHSELLQLRRWNTPAIYNGWEQITRHDAAHDAFNLEETRDFMPWMGAMVGYAVTVVIEPGNPGHKQDHPGNGSAYRRHLLDAPGPAIVVVQDLDKPAVLGAFWGEVNANLHRNLGCVGTITDGGIRDVEEMGYAGFKALARRLCVGHAHSHPVRWNVPVTVFGREILPGQLIHADRHGFLAVPFGEEAGLLAAAQFMDANECRSVIPAAREGCGRPAQATVEAFEDAAKRFQNDASQQFSGKGEWQ